MAFKHVEEVCVSLCRAKVGVRIGLEEGSQEYDFRPQNYLEKSCGATVVAVLSPYENEGLWRGHSVFLDVAQGMRTVDV